MKIVPTLLLIFGITGISNTAMSCDSVVVKMITHPYLDGPLSIEWDVENECTDSYIDEGRHLFSLDDTVLTLTYCLDSGEYRARAKCDFDFQEGMFEIILTMNGDTIDINEPVEYSDDDLRYYFDIHSGCNYQQPSAVLELLRRNTPLVYPNPAHMGDKVYVISNGTEPLKISVMDQIGRSLTENEVHIFEEVAGFSVINCKSLNPGIYIVQVDCNIFSRSVKLVID